MERVTDNPGLGISNHHVLLRVSFFWGYFSTFSFIQAFGMIHAFVRLLGGVSYCSKSCENLYWFGSLWNDLARDDLE